MTDIFKSADWAREAEEKKRRAKGLFTGPTGQALQTCDITPEFAQELVDLRERLVREGRIPETGMEVARLTLRRARAIDILNQNAIRDGTAPPGGSMKDGSE